MPTLTIKRGPQTFDVHFSHPRRLSDLLKEAGLAPAHPCGGRGICGKCAVMLEGAVSQPSETEKRCAVRLSCQATILADATVILPETGEIAQIECGSNQVLRPVCPMPGRIGAAVDIGTTTLALKLYRLTDGQCVGASAMLNPQTSVAADVIGRMEASMNGGQETLRRSVETAIETMLCIACGQAELPIDQVEAMVAAGNTTMLYLLTGRSPQTLSRAPFAADDLFGRVDKLFDAVCYLPPCMHAFVGADTVCALLASGMTEKQETALLCDIGTNGEMALWHQGELYIASTAAGPAFEGAGISCGCSSIPGAIDRVDVENGRLIIHTIENKKPAGLCGSGLVDAVAALLSLGLVDETGAMEEDAYVIAENVLLDQRDIRAVQLAKAAIAAGMACLLKAAGCEESDVSAVYLAGGFGSHLRIESAAAIGLISYGLADRVQVIGNAALDGAGMLLMDTSLRENADTLSCKAHHVRLDANAYFSQRYVEEMLFPETE